MRIDPGQGLEQSLFISGSQKCSEKRVVEHRGRGTLPRSKGGSAPYHWIIGTLTFFNQAVCTGMITKSQIYPL